MNTWPKYIFVIFVFFALATASFAQDVGRSETGTNSSTQEVEQNPTQAQALMKSAEAMIEMCNMMMKKELAMWPWVMAAYVIFGSLLFLALLFFVILEVLWIRFWARKLKRDS